MIDAHVQAGSLGYDTTVTACAESFKIMPKINAFEAIMFHSGYRFSVVRERY